MERLRRMHGLPEKVAQLMSMGRLSDCAAENGDPLPDLPELSPNEVRAILDEELGPESKRVAMLSPMGIPASIGQVHRAMLDNGTCVAIKIQYPGVRESIESDLASLGWLASPFGRLNKDYTIDEYRAELRDMLLAETDYSLEASALSRYAARLGQWPQVESPKPIDGLCTHHVLTMTWIEGASVQHCGTWPLCARQEAAHTLVQFFLHAIVEWREMYADAHPGNFRFRQTSERSIVGILDFGCLRPVAHEVAAAVVRLMDAVAGDRLDEYSAESLLAEYIQLGFNRTMLKPMAGSLKDVTRLLLEPLATDGPFDPQTWHLGARVAKSLGPHRMAFRSAGPAALLGFIRAYYGLISHLEALAAPVCWRSVYLDARREGLAAACGFSAAPVHAEEESVTRLRILVEEHGMRKADVTMPGSAAGRLDELVPDEIAAAAEARGIDIRAIARRATESQFAPQDLFVARDGEKTVRVWLS